MQSLNKQITKILIQTIQTTFDYNAKNEFKLEQPKNPKFGEFACNIAMQLTKKLNKNPRKIAQSIIDNLPENKLIEELSIAGPGFLNIKVKKETIEKLIQNIIELKEQFGNSTELKDQKIMIEFAQPNTHKAFHIGHLRNICLGESLTRIIDSQGAKTFRANFQGDVGMHVAKCLWAIKQESNNLPTNLNSPQEKAEYLGKVYAKGGQAYEKDEKAKQEIQAINKKIYAKDPEILEIWQTTRKWSLEYFDSIYKRLGSHFDQLFFESEMFKTGKELVLKNLKKGIFEESNGAIIFDGEKYGLHKRVFITKEGNPTYEAKDLALAKAETEAFPCDKLIHVVANEQAEYFKVIFKAQGKVFPGIEKKQYHLSYGMVKLTSGKMSSRTGDVIQAEWLIDEAKKDINEILHKNDMTTKTKNELLEKVALGAIKFTMLHTTAKNDIAFDLKKAVKLTGDSGPYLQYAYTRISSILKNFENSYQTKPLKMFLSAFNETDLKLAKKLIYFSEIITISAIDLSPHHITRYLLELASDFSSWYENNSVKNAEPKLQEARIILLKAIQQVLANGLYLLGIETIERM